MHNKRTKNTVWLLLLAILSFSASLYGETQQSSEGKTIQMKDPDVIAKPWTGDLDGMQKRRLVRVLTVYSKTLYFVDKGQPKGIVYDVMKKMETDLNTELKTGNLLIHFVFIPVSRDELLPGLVNGRGDIAAANLTVTPEREKVVDFTDPTYKDAKEILLSGPASPEVTTLDSLSGKEVYVRKSSSFYESLNRFNEELKTKGLAPAVLKIAPENLENEDMIEMLNAGLIKFVVVDSHLASFWAQIFPKVKVHSDIFLRSGVNIAWALRKDSPLLKEKLNAFVKANAKGTTYGNMIFQKYLKNTKHVLNATSAEELKKFQVTVELFRKYSKQYDVDYLLMMAQGYQESRLDQAVKSQVGAVGVMQIMPATGKDLNVGDIAQMEPNINGGVKYMRFMMDQYFKNEPMDEFNKLIFTFASYNAGPGRIRQLRKIAAERGYNPNVWFGHVERIAAEKIGRETVTYVSSIYKYYLAYSLIQEELAQREAVKKATK